ncbi:ribosomal maturation YjgA family protein [Microcoleus sp. herbarium12]|uniref:ribosomal maturation YjgA family protein n=1 Tax=Microcoleus sp. herbarium12 TaxID=3055437 RepID=UPI002FD6A7EF
MKKISLFNRAHPFFNYRVALLLTIIPVLIIGLSSEFYSGPGREFFNDYFGDFLYQIFLILLISFIFPQIDPSKTALGVFIFNCIVEFSQLWRPAFLQAIRATLFGRLFLGSGFSWEDFIGYFLGCTLGWVLVVWLKQKIR